jgi:hypothetical protein
MTYQPTTRFARLRRFAIALLAASTVAVGSLALPTSASALPMSCAQAFEVARIYFATSHVFEGLGDKKTAKSWRDAGVALLDEYCAE